MSVQLHPIYIRGMPTNEELEALSHSQLEMFIKTLGDEIALIQEEIVAMTNYSGLRRDDEGNNRAGADFSGDGTGFDGGGFGGDGPVGDDVAGVIGGFGAAAAGTGMKAATGKRRGQRYKTNEEQVKEMIMTVEDKMVVITEEHERVKTETQEAKERAVESRDLMAATKSEADSRIAELALAQTYFFRDVVAGDPATAMERLLGYIHNRPAQYQKQLRKLEEKSAMIHGQLRKLEQQLENAGGETGDKFIRIDFDQLKIENQQYTERLADKEKELKSLKTTTTRTVQTLNSLMDRLTQLTTEQSNHMSDLDMRKDHRKRLEKELEQVRKDCTAARGKNQSLKIQHESVKVPKVEQYISERSEEFELKKAVQNWRRKVEIARGHVHVMKQKARASKRQSMAEAEARASLFGGVSHGGLSPAMGGSGGATFGGGARAPAPPAGGVQGTSSSSRNRAGASTVGADAIQSAPLAAGSSGSRIPKR